MSQSKDKSFTGGLELLERAETFSFAEGQSLLEGLAAGFFQSIPNSQPAGGGTPKSEPTTRTRTENLDTVYQVLAQQIPAVVFLAFLDEGFGQAYVSPHIETVLGFSQEEWLDDPVRWFKQIHPDDKARWSIEAAQMLLSGQPLRAVYRVIARDGRLVWFQCDARMVRHDNGHPWLIHGVAFDITELKRSQQELQEAHDELERRVEERTAELARTVAALQAEVAVRQGVQEEVQELNRTLEARVLERTEELHNANAELARDIAERKCLEQQLLQAQKMESIGTLAGGIAHDFNNLLNIVQGYTYVLSEPQAQREKIAESATVIHDAVQRGSALVQQLLTIARKTEPKLELSDLGGIVHGLMGLVKQTMPKTIELRVEVGQELPSVKIDSNQITQVLLNLCINARDAMPQGGKLAVRAYVDEGEDMGGGDEVRTGRFVCIEVSDTGVGMDESVQKRIFEPFFTTKEPGHGTGLGLSVAYGILSSHGGFIRVESKPMCGTTFRLYLPVPSSHGEISRPENSRDASSPRRTVNGCGTILLVEDEQLTLGLLRQMLLQSGYRVFAAADGERAIEIFQRHKHEIDAVLLDIGLPRISGWEVFLQMKKENPRVRVVVASGYLEPDLRNRMQSAGISHVVHKPYVPDDVIRALESLISSEPPSRHPNVNPRE